MKVMENQIDKASVKNYELYTNGKMRADNYQAFLDCLTMVFGTEYIGQRMTELKITGVDCTTEIGFVETRSAILKNGKNNGKAWYFNGMRYRRSLTTEHLVKNGVEYIRDMETGEITSGPTCWNCAEYEIWGMTI